MDVREVPNAEGAAQLPLHEIPETRWSVVEMLQANDADRREWALETLCSRYWYPIFAFCVGLGNSREDSKDATQAFFQRLLNKGGFSMANRKRGKLRTFLLTDLRFFLRDEWVKSRAAKRGGGAPLVALDMEWADARLDSAMASSPPPDTLFDQEWAANLFRHAIGSVEAEFAARGKSNLFDSLKPLAMPGGSEDEYETIRDQLGLSVSQMKGAVFRLRRRLRKAIEEALGETVSSPEEFREELSYLREALAASS